MFLSKERLKVDFKWQGRERQGDKNRRGSDCEGVVNLQGQPGKRRLRGHWSQLALQDSHATPLKKK